MNNALAFLFIIAILYTMSWGFITVLVSNVGMKNANMTNIKMFLFFYGPLCNAFQTHLAPERSRVDAANRKILMKDNIEKNYQFITVLLKYM